MNKILHSCLLALLFCVSPAQSSSAAEQAVSASFEVSQVARFGFGNILMGGWTPQDGWINAEQLQSEERFRLLRIWGGEGCRVFGRDGLKSEGVISAIHSEHPGEFTCTQDSVPRFDVHTPSGLIKAPSGLLTVVCTWEPQPRKPVVMKTSNATYRGIVKKYLASRGLQVEQPALNQLFKIDLEGDGVDEVLLCAQNIVKDGEGVSFAADTPLVTETGVPGAAEKGAYSVVILRKLVDGKVLELPLHEYISLNGSTPIDDNWSPPVIAKAYQFADLNGDGVLEIVAGTAHYEGYGYHVFEVKDGKVSEVLANGEGN